LNPLSVPDRPWQHLSVDFVTGLPQSKGYDAICVFVDRLTKQRHLIPCRTNISAQELKTFFVTEFFVTTDFLTLQSQIGDHNSHHVSGSISAHA